MSGIAVSFSGSPQGSPRRRKPGRALAGDVAISCCEMAGVGFPRSKRAVCGPAARACRGAAE
eukprot:13850073-Alexandrium_andersonii.AAC.1